MKPDRYLHRLRGRHLCLQKFILERECVLGHPLHKTNKPWITSIDIDLLKDIVTTGGVDSSVVLFNRISGEILSTLSGHFKKVYPVSSILFKGS
ncbi:hypothetical protein V6N11_079363 [Hibiscus sabdariffa]|uniref:Pre-mRNA-processing factor 19 n=1 Tax=Hibiscus sabdariffa TaxID=183260 RepID=A0ABR2RV68_9ROSI